MKQWLSVAVLLAIGFLGCEKEPTPEFRIVYYPHKKSVKEEWSIIRTPHGDTLKHGTHKHFFWNGAPAQSEVWKLGKREGSSQAWYESGEVKWVKKYTEDKPEGTWRLNRKDGQPWEMINYKLGLLDGTVQIWDKADTSLSKTAQFSAGNCISGDCGLLEFPAISLDTGALAKEISQDREVVAAFRD